MVSYNLLNKIKYPKERPCNVLIIEASNCFALLVIFLQAKTLLPHNNKVRSTQWLTRHKNSAIRACTNFSYKFIFFDICLGLCHQYLDMYALFQTSTNFLNQLLIESSGKVTTYNPNVLVIIFEGGPKKTLKQNQRVFPRSVIDNLVKLLFKASIDKFCKAIVIHGCSLPRLAIHLYRV